MGRGVDTLFGVEVIGICYEIKYSQESRPELADRGGRACGGSDRRRSAPRDINSVSFTWNASTAADATRPVMKIPTLESRLTLEIFAKLCGCRRADF